MSETIKCPYCQTRIQLFEEQNIINHNEEMHLEHPDSEWRRDYTLLSKLIVCTEPECGRIIFSVSLKGRLHVSVTHTFGDWWVRENLWSWNLLPESTAIPYDSSIIPTAIIEDYEEACKITSLSPKASATLYRRCLQWMIRDFHWIIENTLFEEIKKLKPLVMSEVWTAIETVRTCWNIGAHMEKDVNHIIDIDEWEVAQLRWLIEYLMKKWYIQRDEDQKSLASLGGLWTAKTSQKTQIPNP